MILFYRRHKDTLDPEWHFHTDCPHWPDTNFVQMHFINPEMNERFCEPRPGKAIVQKGERQSEDPY